jgi:hypothetical protein
MSKLLLSQRVIYLHAGHLEAHPKSLNHKITATSLDHGLFLTVLKLLANKKTNPLDPSKCTRLARCCAGDRHTHTKGFQTAVS